MVRQLGDVKQVVRHAAEQHAGAIVVKIAEAKLLNMGEHITPHIRFHAHAHPVTDNGDEIIQHAL